MASPAFLRPQHDVYSLPGYQSANGHWFDTVFQQIMELKKEVTKCKQQKKEMAVVIKQDSLVELKGCRPHKLPEVFVQPTADGKCLPREVEIHQNGLCYLFTGSQKISESFYTSSLNNVLKQSH